MTADRDGAASVLASGIGLVVNARVHSDDLDDTWLTGPTLLRSADTDFGDALAGERTAAFAPPLPALLYGTGVRWHKEPANLQLTIGSTRPVEFDVSSVEVLSVSPEALPKSSLHIGVVIAHLAIRGRFEWAHLPLAVREGLRNKDGHDTVLATLERALQPGAIGLVAPPTARPQDYDRPQPGRSLSGAWLDRDIRPVYPVFTLPDVPSGDENARVLGMRELSTGEPLGYRTDKDTSGRLARARADLTVLNDSAETMVLRFGTTFAKPRTSDISLASLQYLVSAQYVDLVALSRLEALVLAEYARTASTFAGRAAERASRGYSAENLLDLTQLRLRLLAYDTSYGKGGSRQSRTHSAISNAARDRAETGQLREDVRQDIAGLVEASKLQDEVAEEAQRRRSNRLSATFATLVAVFSLVTVPQAVVEIVKEVYHVSGRGLEVALWLSFAAIGIIVGLVGAWALSDFIRNVRDRRGYDDPAGRTDEAS